MRNERGKSDKLVQPEKSPNKVEQSTAEGMEGRGLAEGNSGPQNASRTLRRNDAPSALERVRQAAKGNKEKRFTALFHHIYDPEMLRWAYFQLKKQAAPGIDACSRMGNGNGCKREHPKAVVHHHCWPTSISITRWICGSNQWRRKRTGEDVIFVRYADYGVVGFQKKSTAKQFWEELKQRMQKFGLELHPEKTHLLEFGRYAAERRRERGARETGDVQLSRIYPHL